MPSPFVYIDDAADAAIAACFSEKRRQLAYFIAHPEMVSIEDIVSAVESMTGPIAWKIDPNLPHARRGPLDLASATRDLDFTAKHGQSGVGCKNISTCASAPETNLFHPWGYPASNIRLIPSR